MNFLQQNKYNNNNNSYKVLNTLPEPKFNSKKNGYKMKNNNISNSSTSLRDINYKYNFNSQRNNGQLNNYKYSNNTFNKKCFFNINNNSFMVRNKYKNFSERRNFNNNKFV